jgi:hypothetical protein
MDKAALGLSLALTAFATPVFAAEDEVVVALEPSYGLLAGIGDAGTSDHGAGGHGVMWLGISETLWLQATGGGYIFDESGTRRLLYEALGGVVAALDVLRTIPFAEASIGVVGSRGVVAPTFRAGVGADYLVSKNTSIGIAIRYRPVSNIASDGLITVDLRLGLRFEL